MSELGRIFVVSLGFFSDVVKGGLLKLRSSF